MPTVLSTAQRQKDAAAAPRVRALLDAFENTSGVLSPDGKQLLFRSNRDGLPELYLGDVARPGAPPRKLAGGGERIASAIFTRGGRSVLFRSDHGADESFHIFLLRLDSGAVTDLTPSPLWRDSPLVPRDRPDTMVYSARQGDLASSIHVQSLSGGAPRQAYLDPAPGIAVDVSADATRALMIREALAGRELIEVDLATGQARLLSPDRRHPARILGAAYSPDGARVYVASDGGGELGSLVALDRASGAPIAEHRLQATGAVGAVIPSPRGDRVAILVDAGSHSTVRVLDARTLALHREVTTPLGTASLGTGNEVRMPLGGGAFAPDGRRFVLGLSRPDAPDDLFLADTESGAIEPLRREPRAGLSALQPIAASIERVPAFDGKSIPVNVYVPKDGRRHATLVYFHGGPDGATSFQWNAWTRVFAMHGFAVIEPNIRGSTGFGRAWEIADDREKRADAMRDVESVNRWARAQPWCDPDRLVAYGGSYGGYVVLMALTRQPRLWSAGVDLAGIADLITLLDGGGPRRYIAEFGDPKRDLALLQAFSPLGDAGRIVAPLFVYQGQNDTRVPRAQADAIVGALREHRIPVEYMVAANEGHTVAHRENQVEFLTRVLRFLDEARGPPRSR